LIIKAKHNIFVYSFFKWYSKSQLANHFHDVHIKNDTNICNKSILLVTNHVSWWDGFWALYVNEKVFKRKFHFMMLEQQLKKRILFSYSGGFSINKNSRTTLESLKYASDLLNNMNNLVLMFPQGKLHSIYCDKIKFGKGVERIVKNNTNTEIVMCANLVEYFASKKPSLYVYLQSFDLQEKNIETLENEYNIFYNKCLDKHRNFEV
jgi:hypothetical protein